jgi:hypothetical protein
MSQAPVVNEQVINAIDVLTNSGHLTQQEQIDIYKKMLLNQTTQVNVVPASVPSPVEASAASATITVTPSTEEQGKVKRVRNPNPRFTRTFPSKTEIENALARLKLGVDALEVARDLRVSGTYVRTLCLNNGLEYVTRYGKTHRRLTDVEKRQIKELIDAGHPSSHVQIFMDVSAASISTYGYNG